jgi:hypothetical protein
MDAQSIDNVVCEIMLHDGPDRHIDGHDVITQFILALLAGRGEEWARAYAVKHGSETRFIKR